MQKKFHVDGEEAFPSMMSELGTKLTTDHSVSCDDMMTVVHPSRGTHINLLFFIIILVAWPLI